MCANIIFNMMIVANFLQVVFNLVLIVIIYKIYRIIKEA